MRSPWKATAGAPAPQGSLPRPRPRPRTRGTASNGGWAPARRAARRSALEGQEVLRPLPVADLTVVVVPLSLLHVRVGRHEPVGEHLIHQRVVAERVHRLLKVSGQS